jgi:hypothetical protein
VATLTGHRHDHHTPWSPTQPEDTSHAAAAASSRRGLLPAHGATASHRRLRTPAWPAWSRSGQGRPPLPVPPPARSATDTRLTTARPRQRRLSPGLLGWRPSRPRLRPPKGPRPVAVVRVARPPRPGSHASAGGWEETDATGQRGWTAEGWTPDGWTARAGRWTGGQQPAGSADPGRRTRVTGHRTAGQPDLGRRTGWVDTACRTPVTDAAAASWRCRSRRRCRSAGGPLRLRWAGAGWAVYDQERSAARTTRAPRCSGRAWAPPRRLAAGGTPPSSWRLGALLSSEKVGVESSARW